VARSKKKNADGASAEGVTSKAPPGSKQRALDDIGRYIENPDALMVSHGVASNALKSTDNMNISPSKLYEDGGHKLRVIQYLAHRGSTAKCPRDREGMFAEIEQFLEFCGVNKVPPTIGGFAVWCGITLVRFEQIIRDKNNAELAQSAGIVKEIIRNFLEISAMDSSLNPIVYFHQNKVYYGAVENQQVTVRVEDNATEITPEEYAARIELLRGGEVEMIEGEDGVYTVPAE